MNRAMRLHGVMTGSIPRDLARWIRVRMLRTGRYARIAARPGATHVRILCTSLPTPDDYAAARFALRSLVTVDPSTGDCSPQSADPRRKRDQVVTTGTSNA